MWWVDDGIVEDVEDCCRKWRSGQGEVGVIASKLDATRPHYWWPLTGITCLPVHLPYWLIVFSLIIVGIKLNTGWLHARLLYRASAVRK